MSSGNRNNTGLEEMRNSVWDSLTDEQKAKAKACKTVEELIALAGKERIELPDEALDMVSGGCDTDCRDRDNTGRGVLPL